ncbi:MAG TPA: hypothetical protein PK413_10560 [Thermoanaerobaculia bacterium]|nr:hypothetical protein [Thermoanaerobaculia bacterium]
MEEDALFFLTIYAKNQQADLSPGDKKALVKLMAELKEVPR